MAIKLARFALFIALLAVVHLTLHVGLGYGRGAPDLLVAAALLASRRLSGARATALGCALGLLDDALGIRDFGARALALGVISFLGARSRQIVEEESLLFVPGFLFMGAWLASTIGWLISEAASWVVLVTTMPLSAAWSAVAGTFALIGYRRVTGRT
jgi:rod shape-determining protein MreD